MVGEYITYKFILYWSTVRSVLYTWTWTHTICHGPWRMPIAALSTLQQNGNFVLCSLSVCQFFLCFFFCMWQTFSVYLSPDLSGSVRLARIFKSHKRQNYTQHTPRQPSIVMPDNTYCIYVCANAAGTTSNWLSTTIYIFICVNLCAGFCILDKGLQRHLKQIQMYECKYMLLVLLLWNAWFTGGGVFDVMVRHKTFPNINEYIGHWTCGGWKTNRPNDDNRCVHLVTEMKWIFVSCANVLCVCVCVFECGKPCEFSDDFV